MPFVRISLAFQHNSWAKNAGCLTEPILTLHVKLLKHFPMQNVRLVTCAFMIHHAAIKTLTCCSPAIYFPRVSSLFGRHILPYSSLLSLSMTGAEPLSFKSSPPQFFFMAPRKPNKFQNGTAHGPKWKLGRAGNVLRRFE